MIGGQPGLWIDQIPRQLRTIGPYHTSPAPHIASCVRHVRAPRIDTLQGNHNSPRGGGISSQARRRGPKSRLRKGSRDAVLHDIRSQLPIAPRGCCSVTLQWRADPCGPVHWVPAYAGMTRAEA